MSSSVATVVSAGPHKVPILTPGELNIETYMRWKDACEDYYEIKEVKNDKKVTHAGTGFQDLLIRDWYRSEADRLRTLPWDDFAKEFKARWLPVDWDVKARNELARRRQNPDDPFKDWVVRIETLNAVLKDTTSHKKQEDLRNHIESLMCDRLAQLAIAANTASIASYRDWRDKLVTLDNERIANAAEITRVSTRVKQSSTARPTIQSQSSSSSFARTSNNTNRDRDHPPPLTDAERALLYKYFGCFKCRRFFAGHRGAECPNPPLKGAGYKELTEEAGLKAKAENDRKKASSNTVKRATTAAVGFDDELSENVAAAVADSPTASGVLAYGDDSLDSDEYVPPFSLPHFTLRGYIHDSTGPCFNTPVRMLIDCGSSTVLMRSEVADALQLRRHKLPAPISLDSAWGSQGTRVTDFVKLRFSLRSFAWTSRSVRCLVVSELCAPVILGMPFLAHNDLMINCRSRKCIDANTGFDLLNPQYKRASTASRASDTAKPAPPPPAAIHPTYLVRGAKPRTSVDVDTPDVPSISPATHEPRSVSSDTANNVIRSMPGGEDVNECHPTVAAIRTRIEELAMQDQLARNETLMREKYSDVFPTGTPRLNDLPKNVYHRFKLKNPDLVISRRAYDCPKKYREAWRKLLDEHLEAGRMRPSDSPYASPCFLIPKSDPTAAPRWVNDYRVLNDNTVPDRHPLPTINEILSDCARGKIFGKLDMTNSFFQTRVHPDDVPYTAVTTPFGLYEWLVMPQGCRNAPATHQRRMVSALRHLIGKICHVYIDDIIIWSQTLDEHIRNVEAVLDALRAHSLFASPKKTNLFALEVDFLGHHVSERGVEPDKKKIEKVLDWPVPKSASDVRAFIGLVRFMDKFLPHLARFTVELTPLTTKDAEREWPGWSARHQVAFDGIKKLVTSSDCLTVIDYDDLENNSIFVHTDASDWATGATLSFGPTRETARPVAFDSMQLDTAQLNYPVHEKELLAIVRALHKWRLDLLGVPFTIYTDHKTLENFNTQKDLSRRQARWQEFLGQYDYKIVYIPGEENSAADALSRVPPKPRVLHPAPSTYVTAATGLRITTDPDLLTKIKAGYATDAWCTKLPESKLANQLRIEHGLWYLGSRLIVPRITEIREAIFRLAHDTLGHFGFEKSYELIREAYFWPNMRKELESLYVPSCSSCQRNKATTSKPPGPLHPLPVPTGCGDSVAIDFVGPLPLDEGFDFLMTMTCRLNSDIRLVPCSKRLDAEAAADVFFKHWYCENGLPLEIIADRDRLWTSKFWSALHRLTGVKVKLSTAYHPETDGASERTNKTAIQALRYHVARNQTGWVRALPMVRFAIMNTVNASTGFAPFQLRMGRRPRVIPPLLNATVDDVRREFPDEATLVADIIRRIDTDVLEAQDNLAIAKLAQARFANASRGEDQVFKEGEEVLLSTLNRRREYTQRGDNRVAKFMARYDGPFKITKAFPDTSTYTLELPHAMKIFPTFHASMLRRYRRNDDSAFPGRKVEQPPPVVTEDGVELWEVERILERRVRGRGFQWLVQWKGEDVATWEPTWVVRDLEAMDVWERENGIEGDHAATIMTDTDYSFDDLYGSYPYPMDLTRCEAPLCPAPNELDSEASSHDPTPSLGSDEGVLENPASSDARVD